MLARTDTSVRWSPRRSPPNIWRNPVVAGLALCGGRGMMRSVRAVSRCPDRVQSRTDESTIRPPIRLGGRVVFCRSARPFYSVEVELAALWSFRFGTCVSKPQICVLVRPLGEHEKEPSRVCGDFPSVVRTQPSRCPRLEYPYGASGLVAFTIAFVHHRPPKERPPRGRPGIGTTRGSDD